MPATTDSSAPFASLGRSLLSLRRDPQIGSPLHIDHFHSHLADLLQDLNNNNNNNNNNNENSSSPLLSLSWLRRLLDTLLIAQESFRLLLHNSTTNSPALARPLSDLLDRSLKALDLLNALRDGLNLLRHCLHHLRVITQSLDRVLLFEGHVRRARKSLADLTILLLDDAHCAPLVPHRNRSFGRSPHHRRLGSGGGAAAAPAGSLAAVHSRSLSWSVSRSWSAARQLQAIGGNLAPPRASEVAATNGLSVAVLAMCYVYLFAMWALVAAIPCQDRGLQTPPSLPRTLPWAAPLASMQERIVEESRRKDRRNSCGLLREILQIERCSRQLSDVLDQIEEFPVSEEREGEVRVIVKEIVEVCGALEEGLDPVERQVREVFRRIARSRSEGLENLSRLE